MSEWVWGVDCAISHVSIGFAELISDAVEVESIITRTEEREGARLGLLDRQMRIWGRQLAGRYPPACVWVEAPTGSHPNLQLTYAAGVIQAALAEALACPVWSLPVGKWKKTALGHGNASKEQVAAWCRQQRLPGDSQDEFDALAIAWAGREMLRTRKWDVAA